MYVYKRVMIYCSSTLNYFKCAVLSFLDTMQQTTEHLLQALETRFDLDLQVHISAIHHSCAPQEPESWKEKSLHAGHTTCCSFLLSGRCYRTLYTKTTSILVLLAA